MENEKLTGQLGEPLLSDRASLSSLKSGGSATPRGDVSFSEKRASMGHRGSMGSKQEQRASLLSMSPRDEVTEQHAQSSWVGVSLIILASMVGTGVLSLGFAAAALGWVPVTTVILVLGAGAGYSGMLYSRLNEAVPSAKVLADVGLAAYGARGEAFVRGFAYFYLGGVCVVFHLATTSAIENIAYGLPVCKVLWSVLTGCVTLCFAQLRDIHEIGGLATVGTISIFVPVITVLVILVTRGHEEHSDDDDLRDDDNDYDDHTRIVAPSGSLQHLVTFGVGVMTIVYAFSGQVIFLELQSGMAEPAEFRKAIGLSTMVMTVTYLSVASCAYYYVGASRLIGGDPITTSTLSEGATLRVVNSFLAVHVMVAYVIEVNVLARGVLKIAGLDSAVTGDGPRDRATWLAATGSIVFVAFIMSNAVPFFSDLMGLLGAMCAIMLTYTIPIACARKLVPMGPFELQATAVALPLCLLIAAVGTICSVMDIASKMSEDSKTTPFSC